MKKTVRLNIGDKHKVLLAPSASQTTSDVIFFANHGIKTKKPSLVTHALFLDGMGEAELVEKAAGMEKIFVLYNGDAQDYRLKLSKKMVEKLGLKEKTVFVPTRRFEESYKDLYSAAKRVYPNMILSSAFQTSYVQQYLSKSESEGRLENVKKELSKLEDDLRTLKASGSVANLEKTVLSSKKLAYIESFEKEGIELIVKTKNVFMDFVPNVGGHIPPNSLAKNHAYYEMFKAQLLGMNFISPGALYRIPYDMNLTSLGTKSINMDNLLQRLYFGAAHPHIGIRGKCYGEFVAGISGAQKYGVDFLLAGFEVFLRSANLSDPAGATAIRLPMGTSDGKITMWPAIDSHIKNNKIKVPYRAGIKTENYYRKVSSMIFDYSQPLNIFQYSFNRDWFNTNLALIKEREKPEIIAQIEKNISEGKCFIL